MKKKRLFVSILFASVVFSQKSILAASYRLVQNGDFETGTFQGWEFGLIDPTCSPQVVSTIVYGGIYSAFIPDPDYFVSGVDSNVIFQDTTLQPTLDSRISLNTWVYPTKVGSLGLAQYPFAEIRLHFVNITSEDLYYLVYTWSSCDSHASNTSWRSVCTLYDWTPDIWNELSKDLQSDLYAVKGENADLSKLRLFQISVTNHFSTVYAGDFYIDSVSLTQQVVPVGGFWTSINKFELLAPYIGLASLIAVATISIAYVKYRKKKQT